MGYLYPVDEAPSRESAVYINKTMHGAPPYTIDNSRELGGLAISMYICRHVLLADSIVE